MLLRITHKTEFEYSNPVSDTVFEVRKAPSSNEDQTVLSFELKVTPSAPVVSYRDGFGNRVDVFNVTAPYQKLRLDTVSLVSTHRRQADERLRGASWESQVADGVEALEYLSGSSLVDNSPELEQVVAGLPPREGALVDYLPRLLRVLRECLAYEKKVTSERTKLSEALGLRRGVCQDFAHLCIGACRTLGMPARYVSGYVNQPGEIATHAWCQVWCGPGTGWVDVDPTTGQFAGDEHVVVAIGRDYADVPPNRGVWKGLAAEKMDVTVLVEPMERLPNTWEDWDNSGPARTHSPAPALVRGRSAAVSRSHETRTWPAYPNQPLPKSLLYKQQGQQQQQ